MVVARETRSPRQRRKSGLTYTTPLNIVLDSREKLFVAALHLFAAYGVDRVTVRDIANHAGVNSALVGYYFRSKEGLLQEVYRRHAGPMHAERLRLLEMYQTGGRVAALEEVLESFVRPALATTTNANVLREFTRLRALLAAESSAMLEAVVAEEFGRSCEVFVDALQRCLPGLSCEDVLWRFHFMMGTINYTALGPERITGFSEGRCNPLEVENLVRELIPFLAAGFRAPSYGLRLNLA